MQRHHRTRTIGQRSTPRLPPALRCFAPKLDADQLRDLGLCHVVNLDAISRGEATVDTLWQWAGGVLTWSRVADLLQRGQDEMRPQIELAQALIDRHHRTGRVLFTGSEYQLAKEGVEVMDELARIVDRPTAVQAAEWSEARLQWLVSQASAPNPNVHQEFA